MEDGNLIAKVRAQAARENRRQGNLGNQHHRAAIHFNRRVHRANIDFCFAAAGDSVQQDGREHVRFQWLFDRTQRLSLRLH